MLITLGFKGLVYIDNNAQFTDFIQAVTGKKMETLSGVEYTYRTQNTNMQVEQISVQDSTRIWNFEQTDYSTVLF